MNIRWLFGNYADPQYDLTRREQHALSTLAHKKYLSQKRFWLWSALIIIPVMMGFMYALPLTVEWLGYGGNNTIELIGLAIIILISWPYFGWMYRTLYIKPFRLAMREKGWDICISCGYELRGLPDDVLRCPECGVLREHTPNSHKGCE